jgi:hypothetical protein
VWIETGRIRACESSCRPGNLAKFSKMSSSISPSKNRSFTGPSVAFHASPDRMEYTANISFMPVYMLPRLRSDLLANILYVITISSTRQLQKPSRHYSTIESRSVACDSLRSLSASDVNRSPSFDVRRLRSLRRAPSILWPS